VNGKKMQIKVLHWSLIDHKSSERTSEWHNRRCHL